MAALGLLAAASCTSSTYNVMINAIANEAKASGESYRIVTKNGGDPNTDLRTREVDYDVEPPRVEFESRSVPIFARMGGGVRSVIVPTRDSNGNIQYRRVSVMDPPSQELIGFEEKTIPVTVYEKYLRVSARENVSSGDDAPPEQLWSVYVSNEAEDDDIRKALPVLASVVVDYIGVTTETDEEVKVNSETDEVAFIKRGL